MQDRLENILLQVSKSPDIDAGQLEPATSLILNAAQQGLQVERVGIWLYQDDYTGMRSTLIIDNEAQEHDTPLALTEKQYPDYFAALRRERTIIAGDALTNPATHELADYLNHWHIQSLLDVPLRHRGQMVGVMCCESKQKDRQWSSTETAFAGILADLYGRVLSAAERDKFEQLLIQQNEQLEASVKERTQSLQDALNNFKQAQERLVETEKMAALGKLVAGVAHEVNTPLGIAVTATTHCEHRLKKLDQAFADGKLSRKQLQQFISDTLDAYTLLGSNLERAATLIQNFKKTAVDQSSFELVECTLPDYLDVLAISLKPMVKSKQVQLKVSPNASFTLHTYQGALAQIITNLVSNSFEHGFKAPSEENQIHLSAEASDKGAVVRFKDNGIGMNEDTLDNIFEPFYTTARDQGGSGLGLSIVYNLVTRKLKGEIDVQSEPNKGTEFILRLPDLANSKK